MYISKASFLCVALFVWLLGAVFLLNSKTRRDEKTLHFGYLA